MQIKAEVYGEVGVLTVTSARLTIAIAHALRAEARAHVEGGLRVYLIDLCHVVQIDSSGLGALVGVMKHAGRGRRVELCNAGPRVRKALRLTRLDSVFRIHRSVEEGLTAHVPTTARTG